MQTSIGPPADWTTRCVTPPVSLAASAFRHSLQTQSWSLAFTWTWNGIATMSGCPSRSSRPKNFARCASG